MVVIGKLVVCDEQFCNDIGKFRRVELIIVAPNIAAPTEEHILHPDGGAGKGNSPPVKGGRP